MGSVDIPKRYIPRQCNFPQTGSPNSKLDDCLYGVFTQILKRFRVFSHKGSARKTWIGLEPGQNKRGWKWSDGSILDLSKSSKT